MPGLLSFFDFKGKSIVINNFLFLKMKIKLNTVYNDTFFQ